MIASKITEAVIYESPDGGETIYVRRSGDAPGMRQLHSESEVAIAMKNKVREQELWTNILQEAKSNPTLQRALDEAVMIYNLSK
jgi:hypothetical protein